MLAAVLLFLSLDLGRERPVYQLSIAPATGYTGSLKVVLYGDRYDALRRGGAITVPLSGWTVVRAADSVTLGASTDAAPVVIRTGDEPIHLGLLRYSQPSAAILSNGAGYKDQIALQSATESIVPLVVGGVDSTVPTTGTQALFGVSARIGIFALIFFALLAIVFRLMKAPGGRPASPPHPRETVWLALPLALSALTTQLSFYPGNASYDASVQWAQAALGGELSEPLGYAATYLMRLFTLIDTSPALLLALQSVLAALGVALVLRELRFRGVPTWTATAAALALALTPQYPTFFSNLGKDALSAAAILFFSWSLLAAFRIPRGERLPVPLLAALVCAALVAGLMRSNIMPCILVVVPVVLILLHRRHATRSVGIAGVVFLTLAFAIPNGLSLLAKAELREHQAQSAIDNDMPERPPRLFANVYIYHLFSASVFSGLPLAAEDTALFYKLAPREAWAAYDCQMTDTTQTSVSQHILLDKKAYLTFLWDHQLDLARALRNILWTHPGILWNRQTCITRMLWHTAVGERPFQTTATLGYDNPDRNFVILAGPNLSPLPALAQAIQQYKHETETAGWFWLFWKPALPLIMGTFIVLAFVARTRDAGVLAAAALPIASILLLLVVIPFPAYRYAYPAVLMMMLFSTLAFARPPQHGGARP
ncbi:MAG: hypothetical protein ACN6PR_05890 [Achromobacter sp.]